MNLNESKIRSGDQFAKGQPRAHAAKGLLKNNLRKFLTSYMMSFRDKYHGHPDEIQEIVSLDERTISTYLGSN